MRTGIPHSLSNAPFVFNLYILFFFLSLLAIQVVHARPQAVTPPSLTTPDFSRPQQNGDGSSSSFPPTATQNPGDQDPTTSPSPTTSSTSTSNKPPPTTSSTSHSSQHSSSKTTFSPSPTSSTEKESSTTSPTNTVSSSSSSVSSSFSSSVTLIPAVATQSTLNLGPTDFGSTLDVSNIPDATADVDGPSDTTVAENNSSGASSGGFLHNTGAVAGTFTVVGLVVVGGLLALIVTRMRKRSGAVGFSDTDDDYVVNDRSGRTGFASVNYGHFDGNGDNSMTEMSERRHDAGDRSYDRTERSFVGDEVQHTLGQELIQQAPFDPFHNNFAFLDSSLASDHDTPNHQVPGPMGAGSGFVGSMAYQPQTHDLQAFDDEAAQQAPWAASTSSPGHAATATSNVPYRYESHPYASDAVHVTPLRRQASERAEYGLAC